MVVMVGSMISSFAVTVILGRSLSISDFGEFALLKQILLIGFTIAVFGLDYGYIKYFSDDHRKNKMIQFLTMKVIFGISLIFVFIIFLLYPIQSNKLFFIFISVCIGAINLFLAARCRIEEKFFLGQLLNSGWKIIFLILIIIMTLMGQVDQLNYVYVSIPISLAVISIFFVKKLFEKSEQIDDNIDIGHYLRLGLVFWLINSSGLISGGIEKFAIPLIYDSKTLGIFTGTSFLFVISLTMIGSAIGYVIFPQILSGKIIHLWKVYLLIFIITLSSLIIFSLFGEDIVSIMFSGRFDYYINEYLIILFTTIGSLNIVHTILHFILSAHANEKQLLIYWVVTLFNILVFVLFLIIMRSTSYSLLISISIAIIITRFLKIISILILLKKVNNDRDGFLKIIPETV